MNIRLKFTDVDFCKKLVPEAEENYRRALDVMTAYPDYAKTQFRIVLEHLISMLANHFRVDISQFTLFEAINELNSCQVIDRSLYSELHAIRQAGNAVVHSGQLQEIIAVGAEASSSNKVGPAGDLRSAIDARKTLVGIFESVFLLLNKGETLPAITYVEVGDLTSQQMLWKAVTTLDFESKMSAGLILEAQSMAPIPKGKLIVSESMDAHSKTTVRMAAELYWAACEISANIERYSISEMQLQGGHEVCLFKFANTEALYRYARLTYNNNEGEESHRRGVKALEVAAKREFPAACTLYGDYLRKNGRLEDALVMFKIALSKGDIIAYAGLAILYIEKDSPFYSPEKAEQSLHDGITNECNHCKYLLGCWLYGGKELEENKERGRKLLESAAAAGHENAEMYIKFRVEGQFEMLLQQQLLNLIHSLPPIERSRKQGRNDLCACRSGKKYKKCCGG